MCSAVLKSGVTYIAAARSSTPMSSSHASCMRARTSVQHARSATKLRKSMMGRSMRIRSSEKSTCDALHASFAAARLPPALVLMPPPLSMKGLLAS